MMFTTTCLICQHENPLEADVCERCGTALRFDTTFQFRDDLEVASAQSSPATTPDVPAGHLALFVPTSFEPIIIDATQEVVMGRAEPGDQSVNVNFAVQNAYQYGVSRVHAAIIPHQNSYMVEDLGSTNGTMLNGKSLTPYMPVEINPGDRIQIGKFEMLVYFKAQPSQPQASPLYTPNAEMITLIERNLSLTQAFSMTPQYMENNLLPFINALSGLQTVINASTSRDGQHISVTRINAEIDRFMVKIWMTGVMDALVITRAQIVHLRKSKSKMLNQYWKQEKSTRELIAQEEFAVPVEQMARTLAGSNYADAVHHIQRLTLSTLEIVPN